ncbi:MAG TPA: glycosyltransferase family 2 protein [Blastocatellia bacterium]|nr:glycosyltransferase family 2 protein [Blastocatellia bacterium]HMV84647.1 glycosyltransferase family 2 protein [Blastocatellia bacterium]HMX27114.1 glycosyltransferase family 2 protein [Blastocatellia bacterium]HMY74382.1 glycosyltransferase family 2 protein [Blastocatellia bacterium]HMZ18731.1 glycosyltransferase family 2 protein [Blastocatellia bacterium]
MTKNQNAVSGAPSVSVFFPAYNDEGSIAELIEKAFALLPQFTADYEVIVVNDGSSDGTAALLDDLARTQPRLRVVHHPRNRGYGGALRSGFEHAVKDLVFYTDGDGQYDVDELTKLMPLMNADVDVVNGYKIKRSDARRRIVLGGIYKFLARLLFGLPIRDVDCDFRLMRREMIQSIELTSTSGVVCTEMIYKLRRVGCRFTETPVHHYPRLHGQSQFFTLRRVARTGYDFFRLWLKLVVRPGLLFRQTEKRKAETPSV